MYKIFELSTHISTPIALAGFIAAIVFFTYRQMLKNKPDKHVQRSMVNKSFILSLISIVLGFSGYIWAKTGNTSIEGIIYVYDPQKNIRQGVEIKVLNIRKPGVTDDYGRFSIPINEYELRKIYTVQVSYNGQRKFFDIDVDTINASDVVLSIYDTLKHQTPPNPSIHASKLDTETRLQTSSSHNKSSTISRLSENLSYLKYDGLYISKYDNKESRYCIRFYQDGLVVGSAVSMSGVNDTTCRNILRWLNRDFQFKGHYVLNGNKITFAISSMGAIWKYSGIIDEFGSLRLKLVADNGKKFNVEYTFLSL